MSLSFQAGASSTALLLFSHGSLLCGADQALQEHARRLRLSGRWCAVEPGFLNYSDPPFETAVERCVRAGARTIIIVPYFLVQGQFVSVELPRRIASAAYLLSNVQVHIAPPVLDSPGAASAILECAHKALPPSHWSRFTKEAASACAARPHCPLYDSPVCPATGGHSSAALDCTPAPQCPPTSRPPHEFAPLPDHELRRSVLLVVAHGSPLEQSNDSIKTVISQPTITSRFADVKLAYLDCNEPTIPQALAQCAAQGANSILVVPYFLHLGRHVTQDVPALLTEAMNSLPGVHIRMSRYIGSTWNITDVLASRASQALI